MKLILISLLVLLTFSKSFFYRDTKYESDPDDPDYPCKVTESTGWDKNTAQVGHNRYKKKDSKDWSYDLEDVDGVGYDDDENGYFCTADKASDDGVSKLVCMNVGTKDDLNDTICFVIKG